MDNRYNPYTEPSMELFSYHKGLKKLVEVREVVEWRIRDGQNANKGH
jgi:hypothetical protein